jgi:hypothetical protein
MEDESLKSRKKNLGKKERPPKKPKSKLILLERDDRSVASTITAKETIENHFDSVSATRVVATD